MLQNMPVLCLHMHPGMGYAITSLSLLLADASKFCIRNGGIIEKRKHASLVWLYIFPVPDIGTMTLLSQQYKARGLR